jgi:hypothetical protein
MALCGAAAQTTALRSAQVTNTNKSVHNKILIDPLVYAGLAFVAL